MEDHEIIVHFDQYCKTCRHERLGENESPCDECLEHPVNINSNRPVHYEKRT